MASEDTKAVGCTVFAVAVVSFILTLARYGNAPKAIENSIGMFFLVGFIAFVLLVLSKLK
jgi:hypothetical protein